MSDLVVIDASVLLAIALPDPQANKDYASALLFAIDKGDVTPVLTQLCCQEVAAKLVRKVRGLVITAVKARAFFDLLSDVSFMHVVDVRDFESLFSDAMTLGCGSYDAAYEYTERKPSAGAAPAKAAPKPAAKKKQEAAK